MTFDDYNYTQYNDHVLLEEPDKKKANKMILERQSLTMGVP
jgi:hypothetical protein